MKSSETGWNQPSDCNTRRLSTLVGNYIQLRTESRNNVTAPSSEVGVTGNPPAFFVNADRVARLGRTNKRPVWHVTGKSCGDRCASSNRVSSQYLAEPHVSTGSNGSSISSRRKPARRSRCRSAQSGSLTTQRALTKIPPVPFSGQQPQNGSQTRERLRL